MCSVKFITVCARNVRIYSYSCLVGKCVFQCKKIICENQKSSFKIRHLGKNEATAVKANDGVDVNLRLLVSSGDVCIVLVQLAFYLVSNYQKSFEVANATDLLPNDKRLCSTSFENSHRWLD